MNTQQEHDFAKKVVTLLDQGAQQMDAQTNAKLLQARKEALAHFQEKPVRAWAPAWASDAIGRITEPLSHNLSAGFALLALLACLAGYMAWQNLSQQGSEVADLDQALLTDELPINAYLDKGFESWLKGP